MFLLNLTAFAQKEPQALEEIDFTDDLDSLDEQKSDEVQELIREKLEARKEEF